MRDRLIPVISLLASVLALAVACHLTRTTLGELPEQIILLVVSVAAMACVIASLLVHGRRIVFWLFFAGYLLNAFAQASDNLGLAAAGTVFFVGSLAWNIFILRRLVHPDHAMSGVHRLPKP